MRAFLALMAFLTLTVPAWAEPTLAGRFVAAAEQGEVSGIAGLLDQSVRDSARVDWSDLFVAASYAAQAGRAGDAHFLYHAAQMRSRAEMNAFPPTTASEVAELRAALKQQVGAMVNPMMVSHAEDFIAAVGRLQRWQPVFAKGFQPDWPVAGPSTSPESAYAEVRQEHLSILEDLAWYLRDPVYLDALRARQAGNLAAEQVMRDIEKRDGRAGFMGTD